MNHSARERLSDFNPFAAASSGSPETSGVNPFAPGPSACEANPFGPQGYPSQLVEPQTTTYPSQEPSAAPAASGARPLSVRVAYLALLAASILAVGLAGVWVYLLTEFRQTVDNAMEVDPSGTVKLFVTDYADNAQIYLTAAILLLGIMLAGGYVAVARAVRKGRRWPRILCPVLVLLSLPAVFLGHIAIAIVACGMVATAAAWMPAARAYAAGRQRCP